MSDIVVEQPAVVEAALNYLVATGEKPATYAYEPPAGEPQRSGVYRMQRVNIVNARVSPPPGGLSLDRNGFELRQHASALSDFSTQPRSNASTTLRPKRCSSAGRVRSASSSSITRFATVRRRERGACASLSNSFTTIRHSSRVRAACAIICRRMKRQNC